LCTGWVYQNGGILKGFAGKPAPIVYEPIQFLIPNRKKSKAYRRVKPGHLDDQPSKSKIDHRRSKWSGIELGNNKKCHFQGQLSCVLRIADMSSLFNRRSNAPWIQRKSRLIIGAIAIVGALNTAYLTITKLTNTQTVCVGGCEQVLSSPYATVFGQPLALYGLLAYISMALFALVPLAVNAQEKKPLRTALENITWLLLFAGATAMLVFSGYLMNIMVSKFVIPNGVGAVCYYCIASAIFALSLFVLTLIGRAWEDMGQLLFIGGAVAIVTIVGTLGIYAPIETARSDSNSSEQSLFPIQNSSGPAEIALANHLKQKGVKMYGAYWCPHCYEQKELFGKEAAKIINYIECDAQGKNSQEALCKKVAPEIEKKTGQPFAFPTWEINGQYYRGIQPLADLAKQSEYSGPTDFKNKVPTAP
jgi:uncharacterized membrane protein